MSDENERKRIIHETLMSKMKGQYIKVKTTTGYYIWGDLFDYDEHFVTIRPFHTDDPKELHPNIKAIKIWLQQIDEVE